MSATTTLPELERTAGLAGGRASIGVAAYPHRHPESPTTSHNTEVLVGKERTGADFAIPQVFFDSEDCCRLLARSRSAGIRMPLVAGFVPTLNPAHLTRLAAPSGVAPPRELLYALETAADTEREDDEQRVEEQRRDLGLPELPPPSACSLRSPQCVRRVPPTAAAPCPTPRAPARCRRRLPG